MASNVEGAGDREERPRRRRERDRLSQTLPRVHPKYPESKHRVPKSFSFISRACMHAFSGSPHDAVCICLVIKYVLFQSEDVMLRRV